jgi:hypothetical protein
MVAFRDEAASAPAGHQNLSICIYGSLPGVGEDDFPALALGQFGDDEYILEASGGRFFRLFHLYVGRSGRVAHLS